MNLDKRIWQWTMLVILAFIWGSSFILIKKALISFSSSQVAALRIFISFVIVIPFIIRGLKKITKKNVLTLCLVGFVGNLIPALFFTTAQTEINSTLAGMLNSLTPLFTMLVGVLIFRTAISKINVVGLIIGIIGASGLAIKDFSTFFDGNNWYSLFVVAATFCYGFNVNLVKEKLKDLNALEITSLAFLFTGPFAGLYLAFSDYSSVVLTPDYKLNFIYICLLAIFSSVIAVYLINVLIKHTTAVFASSVTYLIPIFAIIWGLIDKEVFLLIDILWISITLLGVYLINKSVKNET